jgi:uncharacterized protein (TIGR03067 family)
VRCSLIRSALFGSLVVLTLAGARADDKADVPKELAPFQGTWKVVSLSLGGVQPKDKQPEVLLRFEGNKVIVTEGGKEEKPGTVAADPKKNPATIDLTGPKGEKMAGLYKIDKDGKLTLCLPADKDGQRPKSFDDKTAVVMVLEKQKK